VSTAGDGLGENIAKTNKAVFTKGASTQPAITSVLIIVNGMIEISIHRKTTVNIKQALVIRAIRNKNKVHFIQRMR